MDDNEELPDFSEAEKDELCQEFMKNLGGMAGMLFGMCKIPNYVGGTLHYDDYFLEVLIRRKNKVVDHA